MEKTMRRRLDRPLAPLLLVLLSPVVSAPATWGIIVLLPECGLDESWWELGQIRMAFLPGLAGLLPFLWLASRAVGVRRAAIIAGLIGSARLAIPQASVALYAAFSGGQEENPSCSVSIFLIAALLLVMLAIWSVSVVLGAAVAYRAVRGSR